ncbi:Bicoid-interacting protein 3-domain-containing protein [Zychaea mexicana]|uniref:Bicoid-interacting protein 3-domain-containing protein n=1 Tax=Zychaea mexicana TaxID=64656 RepID=UPI0022FE35D9|nr:Bicoid-interacting protein 3-domain-containing protein [Zychaea mexicana]KAI9498394.1 Bicoid-interacting protein 3-domain-containing protein [Zychaea mexicana]
MRGHNVLVKKQPNRRSEQYIYGNYRNYYESRRGNQITVDHRLDMLDPSLFKGKRVLDIGCNSGNITTVIGLQHKPTHILGVDIDESLIKQAEKQLRLVNSLHNPHGDNATDVHMRFHYFPRALSSTFGFIAMNMPPNHKSTEFPYNVKFKAKDWLDDDDDDGSAEQDGKKRKGNKQKKIRYDTVLALSITKWIHINRGDEGMKEFFNKVYKVLNPGGAFVVEPQEFDTYERRAKLNETTQAVFKSIEFRPEQFHDYLMKEVGFSKFEDLGSSGEKRKGKAVRIGLVLVCMY